MEKRTIRVKPSCFAPEFEMIIPIPTDRDDEEYIDELLDGILSTEFRYNAEWDFDRGFGSEIWACEGEWREVECPQRKAVNIQWDIDPEDDDGVELPNEITIPNDIEDGEAISDYISDVTGFCHKGFELEEQL